MMTDERPDVDFYHVFTVTEGGTIIDGPAGVYAPGVWHSDTEDVEIEGDGWTPLTGYTGQDRYHHGAVMHASEQFAGRIVRDVLAEPGTYVLVPVEVIPDDEDDEPEPAGWAVLRRVQS